MTLPLELGGIEDSGVRRSFEQIALNWPTVDRLHQVGAAGEPAFANGWVNFDAASATSRDAAFYKYNGRVYLQGLIKNGTIGLGAFTLPAGYRPLTNAVEFAAVSNGAFGVLDISLAGVVTPGAGNNASFWLDGFSFRVA